MLKKHSLHLSVQKTRHSSTNFGMAFQYRIVDGAAEALEHYGPHLIDRPCRDAHRLHRLGPRTSGRPSRGRHRRGQAGFGQAHGARGAQARRQQEQQDRYSAQGSTPGKAPSLICVWLPGEHGLLISAFCVSLGDFWLNAAQDAADASDGPLDPAGRRAHRVHCEVPEGDDQGAPGDFVT